MRTHVWNSSLVNVDVFCLGGNVDRVSIKGGIKYSSDEEVEILDI